MNTTGNFPYCSHFLNFDEWLMNFWQCIHNDKRPNEKYQIILISSSFLSLSASWLSYSPVFLLIKLAY